MNTIYSNELLSSSLLFLFFRYEGHAESCMMNHHGSAASMETEGSLELFQRSMERDVR